MLTGPWRAGHRHGGGGILCAPHQGHQPGTGNFPCSWLLYSVCVLFERCICSCELLVFVSVCQSCVCGVRCVCLCLFVGYGVCQSCVCGVRCVCLCLFVGYGVCQSCVCGVRCVCLSVCGVRCVWCEVCVFMSLCGVRCVLGAGEERGGRGKRCVSVAVCGREEVWWGERGCVCVSLSGGWGGGMECVGVFVG